LQLPPRATESSLPSPSGPTAAFTMEEVKTPGAMEEEDKVYVPGSPEDLARFFAKVKTTESDALSAKHLDWGWKVLGPEDGAALAHVISKNKTCITLDLFVNEIFEEAGVAVGKALASNMVLKSLDLQQAQVGVPGAKAIAAALKANIPLMNLKMHYNHLGPEGVGAIAEALKTNDKLTNLDLGDNGMMKEGVQALAAMLQKNTKLMRLDCSKNAGLWGDDAMKGVLTKAGEQHDAARKKAKKLIPQDELPFKLIMEDSPGQMWSPNGFVNVVKYPKQRRPKTNRDEPVVI